MATDKEEPKTDPSKEPPKDGVLKAARSLLEQASKIAAELAKKPGIREADRAFMLGFRNDCKAVAENLGPIIEIFRSPQLERWARNDMGHKVPLNTWDPLEAQKHR